MLGIDIILDGQFFHPGKRQHAGVFSGTIMAVSGRFFVAAKQGFSRCLVENRMCAAQQVRLRNANFLLDGLYGVIVIIRA